MIRIYLILICLAPLMLSGCTGLGLATGAAAVTGVAAAQEGGLNRAVSDGAIKLKINDQWFQYDLTAFAKLKSRVNQGRVLVTGVVQNPEHRVEAIRRVWLVPGVTQVINEIQVANSKGITGFVKDKWITARLRGAIALDRSVQSINYSIDTVQSIIYLMGVAQNQAELNRVIETARTIAGVRQVVSYVKLAGEPLAGEQKAAPIEDKLPQAQPLDAPQNIVPNTNLSTGYDYGPVVNSQPVTIEEPEQIAVPTRPSSATQPDITDSYY